ncbi:B- and T-lymphocyte attenuator isoform X2 [Mustelus asterias]
MRLIETCNYFLLAACVYFTVHLEGSYSCPLRVGYPRAVLNYSIGDSLTLNCTILYCGPKLPEITWCKLHSNSCEPVEEAKEHKFTPTNNSTEQRILLVFTISSINLTDRGTYRCQAKEGSVSAMGHTIVVNVFETTTNSTMKPVGALGTPPWIFYSIIVMGILGTVLFLVLITYFCIRNMNEFRETRQRSDSCGKHECHTMTQTNGKPTIYENTNECSEGVGCENPNSLTVNNCNNPANHRIDSCSSDNNTIIYASLNTSMLCRKPSITIPDEEDTEYAAINIRH